MELPRKRQLCVGKMHVIKLGLISFLSCKLITMLLPEVRYDIKIAI